MSTSPVALTLKQLTDVDTKCLPYGRQALAFDIDFSQNPNNVLTTQQANLTRNFGGVRGMMFTASANEYVLKATDTLNGAPPSQLLLNPASGIVYAVNGATIQALGSPDAITLGSSGLPAGTTLITQGAQLFNTFNPDANANFAPYVIDSEGWIYGIAHTGADPDVIYACKIDSSSGACVASTEITGAPGPDVASTCIDSDGNFWFYFTASDNLTLNIQSFKTSDMSLVGAYTYKFATSPNQAYGFILQTSGGIMGAGYQDNTGHLYMVSIDPSTLDGGAYTGNVVDCGTPMNGQFESTNTANKYGGIASVVYGNETFTLLRFDGPQFGLTNTATISPTSYFGPDSILDNVSATPWTGADYISVLNFIPAISSNYNNVMQLMQYDTYSLTLAKTYTLMLPSGFGGLDGMSVIDTDNGEVYMNAPSTESQIMDYAVSTEMEFSIAVQQTGQTFNFSTQENGTLTAWIPLYCLNNDTINIVGNVGTLVGFLTNFDVEPYMIES